MKKSLAKKITLSILAGAMLMTSSVAWAMTIGPNTHFENNGLDNNSSSSSGIAIGTSCGALGEYSIAIGNNVSGESTTYACGE